MSGMCKGKVFELKPKTLISLFSLHLLCSINTSLMSLISSNFHHPQIKWEQPHCNKFNGGKTVRKHSLINLVSIVCLTIKCFHSIGSIIVIGLMHWFNIRIYFWTRFKGLPGICVEKKVLCVMWNMLL